MQMILPGARSNKGHLVPRGGGGEGTFGTRASSARLNRGPNIYDSPPSSRIYYRRRNAISRGKESSRIELVAYLCYRGLIHGPPPLNQLMALRLQDDLYGCGLVIWIAAGFG